MSAAKITKRVHSVGVLNPAMRVFDVIMKTEFGTSYNAYIVQGDNKTALIETCHATFFDAFTRNIREVCNPSDIDYIIVNHTEPDHSGALAALAALCPKAEVYASVSGATFLKNITNNPTLPVHAVKDGDTLDLGGATLKFIIAPFLHWPDSMFTYCAEEKVLFPCDFLGAHYCEPYVFDFNCAYPEKYSVAFKEYYDAIFGPFKPYVLKGLEKIEGLDIDFVCHSHGPILTGENIARAKTSYKEWSAPTPRKQLLVPVFYCSAYSNTKKIAGKIREGILSVLPDANVPLYDIIEHNLADLAVQLNQCDAFGIGSCTINGDAVPPVWQLLAHVDAINNKKKPVFAFGSYGWSGEAVPNINARLNGLKTAVYKEGFRKIFVPSEAELEDAFAFGQDFARDTLIK